MALFPYNFNIYAPTENYRFSLKSLTFSHFAAGATHHVISKYETLTLIKPEQLDPTFIRAKQFLLILSRSYLKEPS